MDGDKRKGRNAGSNDCFTMFRRFIIFAILAACAFACSSRPSGGCGCGGGCGGGCRAKARGVLKLTGDDKIEEDFGQIYGLRLWEKRNPDVPMQQATDPNYLFVACCAERGLSVSCQTVCNFREYNQNLASALFSAAKHAGRLARVPPGLARRHAVLRGAGPRPPRLLRATGEATGSTRWRPVTSVWCSATRFGEDRNVNSGGLNLQIPDKYTHIDYTYASCFGKFDDMKQCFYENVQSKAKAFFSEEESGKN
ncbi:hypothetical protein PRIPAC_95536 [Pristionchus pacificus]|uniref:Uncharacterized protein n=1 Tax=Pristionchus pacificus TaxID=54126 RepID=A0A2A6BJ03_PRIPA|nr:hypothetical protein PRIPAC_95536 [Pristionchus pacificus]|eukprot:PDM65806.1 hypothetical protein PRIPAC_45207 [Pristionchus pacificus]